MGSGSSPPAVRRKVVDEELDRTGDGPDPAMAWPVPVRLVGDGSGRRTRRWGHPPTANSHITRIDEAVHVCRVHRWTPEKVPFGGRAAMPTGRSQSTPAINRL